MWRCTDYKTGYSVLDCLKFADQGLRETSQKRVAIVNAWEYERNNQSFGGIISEVVANSTNTSDFQESSFADEIDVFLHREILVRVETKVPDWIGEGNGGLADRKRCRWMLEFWGIEKHCFCLVYISLAFVFSHPVFHVKYAGLESVPGVVKMFWTTWFAQLSDISKELVRTGVVE